MRAVIYCRVSTAEQTQNLSLRTQEKHARDYCKREGLDVARVFIERGESAKTVQRTEFLNLLKFCREQKGKIHVLVVYALNRFSRNTVDHHAIRSLLAGLGIQLRSVTESIDDTPTGRLMESIIAAMAQWDNDVRPERTRAGMREAVSRGRWVWTAPLGYRSTHDQAGPSLQPDEDTAAIVRRVFELYAGGASRSDVLASAAGLGLKTKNGKALTPQSLHNLLTNPIYVGRIRASKWNLEQQGDFDPLVSDDLFRQVQRRLQGKHALPEPRRRDNPEFPLRRFVRCGCCGTPLTGSRSRGRSESYAYYHCRKGCEGIAVRKSVLEAQFLELLATLEPRIEYLRLFRAVVLDAWRAERGRAADLCAALDARLSEIRSRIDRVEEAFLFQRSIDRQTYDSRLSKLREELALAEIQRSEAHVEQLDVEGVLAFAEHVLTRASALWSNASLNDRRALQQAIFPNGLPWTSAGFGTAVTSSAFSYLRGLPAEGEGVASPAGFEPALPA